MFAERKLLYLSRADVAKCGVGVADIIEAVEGAFRAKGEGRVELPPKPGIHPRPDSFIHAMPCYIGGLEAAGIKWVSGYAANPDRGLPYVAGLLVLNDAETGLPTAVMDCTWITAWRTAAVSALAAKLLARSDATRLAICGTGVQGRSHLDAFALVLENLSEVRAYDSVPEVLERYVSDNRPRHPGLRISAAVSPQEAVEDADVVLTAAPILKEPRPVVENDWLAPGSLGLPIDFDSYFAPSAFMGCDKLLTDDVDQIRYYQELGYFPNLPEIHGDLGQLVTGQIVGRQTDDERIIACNLGIAMDDVATAPLLVEKAKAMGLGTWLDL
jgi:ornithine cyclodeaminase/alanine dehydrogenase